MKGTFEACNLALVLQCPVLLKEKLWQPLIFQIKAPRRNPPKLLDQVRDKLQVKHYSIRTEQAYTGWIKRYIFFHGKKHTKDMGADERRFHYDDLHSRPQ